jgi:hypothetical protein
MERYTTFASAPHLGVRVRVEIMGLIIIRTG